MPTVMPRVTTVTPTITLTVTTVTYLCCIYIDKVPSLLGRDCKVADIPGQQHYVELMEKDVVKFGFSTREYILLHIRT